METIPVTRVTGDFVEGEALVSAHAFSPRYDLDRWSGVITRHEHDLHGISIVDKVCFFIAAKGGIAAGWALYDLKAKGIAPRALVFGEVNPVLVQGAIFAGITLADGWDHGRHAITSGAWVRIDPNRRFIRVLSDDARAVSSFDLS